MSMNAPSPAIESAVQQFSKEIRQLNLATEPGADVAPWAGRSADSPMVFQFAWRSRRFRGSVSARPNGSRVALTAFVPESATTQIDASGGGSLLAVIDVHRGQSMANIRLLIGSQVLLDDKIELPGTALTIDGLVAGLTSVVLAAAPYLDLLSRVRPTNDSTETPSLQAAEV